MKIKAINFRRVVPSTEIEYELEVILDAPPVSPGPYSDTGNCSLQILDESYTLPKAQYKNFRNEDQSMNYDTLEKYALMHLMQQMFIEIHDILFPKMKIEETEEIHNHVCL